MKKKYYTEEERKAAKKNHQAAWVAKNPEYFREYRRLTRNANAEYQKKYLDGGDNREKHNERQRISAKKKRMQECINQLEKENIV